MSTEEASNSPFGSEPSGEVKYLSDGTGRQPDIIGVERQEISTIGKRFLKASGGDACLVVVGPLVSQWEVGGQSTESAIIRCCLGRFGYPGTPFPGTIDLVLDTLGGSLDTAFKTVLFLSRFTERLRVFVPRRAKSSGTLIAIGANELYLSPFGELGPLDTQIRDPRNPASKVSALDCYQSVDYVRTFGLNTLSQAFKALATETRVLIPLRAADKVVSAVHRAGVRRSRARSRTLSYSASRMVAAMSSWPAWRMSPMLRLRRVARARGREPARTWDESSRRVTSRTRWSGHHTAPSLSGDG